MIDLINPIFVYSYLREKAYTSGLKKRVHLKVPVLSVGNLQFGGSGKTPFVMYLLERFKKYKMAVISQSYKAQLNQPERVDLTKSDFQKIYGDEPSLIKKLYPAVDVWCGPKKWRTAQAASEFSNYDFLILDDGFTHHQLFRDLDLVLFDGSRSLETYRLPPLGQLRERFSACARADAVIVTKIETFNPKSDLIGQINHYKNPVGWARYSSALDGVPAPDYFLFAGIGNFDFFLKNAKDLKLQIQSFEKFENHVDYTEELQKQILDRLKKSKLRGLTTLKDLIKITNSDLLNLTDCLKVKVDVDKNTEQWLDQSLLAVIHAKNR